MSEGSSISPLRKLEKIADASPGLRQKVPAKHTMMTGGPPPAEPYSEPSNVYLLNVFKLKERAADVEIRTPMLVYKT